MALALCKFVSTTSWLKHLVQLVFSLLFELLWHLRHKSFALSSWQELLHYSLLCMLLRLELFIRAWALAETSISKMLPGQVSLWKSLSPQCIHSSHKTPYHMITTVKFKTSIHCFSSSSSAPTPPHFLFRLLLSPGFLFPSCHWRNLQILPLELTHKEGWIVFIGLHNIENKQKSYKQTCKSFLLEMWSSCFLKTKQKPENFSKACWPGAECHPPWRGSPVQLTVVPYNYLSLMWSGHWHGTVIIYHYMGFFLFWLWGDIVSFRVTVKENRETKDRPVC